jgi:cytoskeleton protein RodZ
MVEDVAARLKIHARILRAIEEGDTEDLPHFTYTRGFIKGYALILGYSGEKVTTLLDSLENFSDDSASRKPAEKNLLDEAGSVKKGVRKGLFAMLLGVALLGGGGYYYYVQVFAGAGPPSDAPHPAAVPETPAPPVFPSPNAEATGSGDPVAGAASLQENGPPEGLAEISPADSPPAAQEDVPSVSEADPVSTSGFAPLPPAAVEVAVPAPAVPVPAEGMHQVVITAEADCWVHAQTDHTETREFTLRAGDTFALPFRASLALRLGNAGGVRIVYDGKEIPPVGSSGQVRNIVFPPAG